MARLTRSGLWAVSVVVAMVASAAPRANASGDALDLTFRRDGTAVTNLTPWNENVGDIAIQSNGRIVIAGRKSSRSGYGRFAIIRYRPNGRLDRRFGGDGIVTTNIARREDAASAVGIQADGKIVLAGTATLGGRDTIVLARYRRHGSLDASFGDAGTVTLDLAEGGGDEEANALAIQPDGRIVIVGATFATDAFVVARLEADGTLDASFHADGIATTPIGGVAVASAVAIQPDEGIVVAGQSWTEGGFDGIHVVRYQEDGDVDEAFGAGGIATASFTTGSEGGGDAVGGVAVQHDGGIVVAGDAGGSAEYTSRFGLARFDADGRLDPSFHDDGIVRTNFTRWDDSASDLVIEPGGRIVAVGVAGFGWGSLATFALARYSSDGSLDPSFGDSGKLRTVVGGTQPIPDIDIVGSWATAVALQADGRIVVAGDADRLAGGRIDGRFAVARYLS